MMVDDNFLFFDHLISEKEVREDGKFSLAGKPNDDDLNILLIVVHRCHAFKVGRHDSDKIKMYSEFEVKLEDLKSSNWNLELNIELKNNTVKMFYPGMPVWKTLMWGKRFYSDSVDRIKELPFWKNT